VPHDQLWAPWRLPYIVSAGDQPQKKHPEQDSGCFLCRYAADEAARDRENFVLFRGRHSLTVLNRFPYNNGHLLVAPLQHKAELSELSDDELLECMHALQRMTDALRQVINADGFNIGLNLGAVAGAGLPGHLHWHLVPRWRGDTNFMSVVADLRVIPQSLSALFELAEQHLQSLPPFQ